MDRSFYLNLAASGLRMPIGSDLVLREKPDHADILLDGPRFGKVLEEAAIRYKTPLAIPVMDLMLEKASLLSILGMPADKVDTYHFETCPADEMLLLLDSKLSDPLSPRMQANVGAVRYVADHTSLVPVGMTIGPFSLMTKLLADPITPVYMAGAGMTADEDEEVRTVERALEMSVRTVLRSVEAQLQAGAKAVFIAEPAANKAYFSPNQLAAGSDIFDRYVIASNKRVEDLLQKHGADMIFHCCGELIDPMVRSFTELDPVILSLGSSRRLWEDAAIVPKNIVLFGNMPTRKFLSDDMISPDRVRELAVGLLRRMRAVGHPFILGSECDVLSVSGCEETIKRKVDIMLNCACP